MRVPEAAEWRWGGVRNLCLMGAELQFEVMKKFWGCWRWMDAGDDTIILKENRKKTTPNSYKGLRKAQAHPADGWPA